MEHHRVVVDHRVGRRVDAADGEGPVAREDGALERHVLAHLPAEQVDQPRADERARAVLEERLALVGRHRHLGVQVEVGLRVHGEVGEEPLAVAVLPAEPVGPGHLLDAGHGREPLGVRHRQREDEAAGVGGHQPARAPELGGGAERGDDGAERGEQEQRERHARHGEKRAPLVAAEIGEDERQESHEAASRRDRRAWPCSTNVPFSRWSCRLARAAACGSWVTTMIVLPNSSLSRPSSASTSCELLRVELAGGLVEQDQRRVGHDRARDGHPLLLAARELARVVVQPVVQADDAERDAHPLLALLLREPGEQERQLHVLERGEDGQQVERLEHEARRSASATPRAAPASSRSPRRRPRAPCRWWACRARR